MTKLSLNKAAKEAGVAKSTLLDALKTKRMSAEKNDKGHWSIDPAELFRVFPKTSSNENVEPTPTTQENHQKTNDLQAEIKALTQEKVERLETQIEELRLERDEWRKQAQQLALAAPSQQSSTELPEKGRGLWGRILGR